MAVIQGDEGIDFLIGTPEDDSIFGGWSGDFIYGADGDDLIFGDAGNDVMIGGEGADTHHFGASSGNDLVTDFNPSEGDEIAILIQQGVTVDHVDYNPFWDATTVYFDPEGKDTVTFLGATQAEVERAFFFV
jgi:Ca2+-binding RTX toxin-like protein